MIVVQTPFRISLFGGGTDFPDFFLAEGGSVLTTAINKYIYVVIKSRFEESIRISYTRTEIVNDIEEIRHELIRESLRKTGITQGVEVVTLGDIPSGTGLGSSSSVTVGALHSMYALQGKDVDQVELARQACEIEVNTLKKPIGYQDQYIAALGGLRFIEFRPDGTIGFDLLNLSPDILRNLNDHLMLFFTGIRRKSETILAEQKENISNKMVVLRELKKMAFCAREELANGEIHTIGHLLHESWNLKRTLANGITNGDLNQIYSSARKAGALGGKITGAGGGGFLLLFCEPEKQDAVRSALYPLRELSFGLEPEGSKVILNKPDFV